VIRRWLPRAVACSAVAFAAAIVMPALAAAGATAATSAIVVGSVSSPLTESGLVSIQMQAPTPISLTAVNIVSGSDVVLTVPAGEFTLTSGTNVQGTWTISSPIPQSELAFGTYQVTVTASDTGGDSINGQQAPGSLFYGLDPSVTLSTSATTLSFSQQNVTFSGQVTAYYPDGSVQAVISQPVSIQGNDGDSYTATTDSKGNYSVTAAPALYSEPAMTDSYTANVAASASVQAASSAAIGLTAQVNPVHVSVSLSTSVARFGAKVTLRGVAKQQSDGTLLPLANATMDITGTDFYSNRKVGPIHATTRSNGRFSVVLPAQPTTTWTATAAPSPYLITTGQSGSANSAVLTVSLPTRVISLRLKYNPAGQLTATGCLVLAPSVTSFPDLRPPPGSPLSLQYAASRHGRWHKLGALGAGRQACRHGVAFGQVYGSAPLSGYFRVSYGGQLRYQPTVSAVGHAATARTRFVGFDIRRRSVSRNGRITVSGELERKTAHGWTGLAGAKITILIEPPGSDPYWFKRLTVGKSGKFRSSFADPQSASWYVAYGGDSRHLSAQSNAIYVRVGH
jgi:hypothetical protein